MACVGESLARGLLDARRGQARLALARRAPRQPQVRASEAEFLAERRARGKLLYWTPDAPAPRRFCEPDVERLLSNEKQVSAVVEVLRRPRFGLKCP